MDKLKSLISKQYFVWILFLVWVLFITNLWLPRNWDFYGNGDWDLTYSTFEAARISILQYGEWPSYQPYLAFGSDLNANPQAVHASIFFIPVLLFGSFYGVKVSMLLALLIGLFGAKKLFQLIGGDTLISTLMAMVFVASPYFSRHIIEAGHSNFLYMLLLPYLFFHVLSYYKNQKIFNFLMASLILTQILAGGAPFAFIVSSLALVLWSIGLLWIEKINFGKVLPNFLFIFIAIGLNLWKILPILDLWNESPRLVNDESGINILVFLHALNDSPSDTGTPHAWHEISIGFPLVLLAFIIYKIQNIDSYLKWILLFIPIIWIGLGNMPAYVNPWYILNHYVPGFTSLRAPYRFAGLSLLIFSIVFIKTSKFYIDNKLFYIVLIAITLSQTLSFNAISRNQVFSERIAEITLNKDSLFQVKRTIEKHYQYVSIKNQNFIQNAYEPLTLKTVKDSVDQFISGAQLLNFSPTKISLAPNQNFVKIGLRYSSYWEIDGNGKLSEQNGLLVYNGPIEKFTLKYSNPIFKRGLLYSLIFLVFIIAGTLYSYFRLMKQKNKLS